MEQGKIDLVANNITFESKQNYNKPNKTKKSVQEMFAQLIATHQKQNTPFKKYIGVFDEREISFMESKYIKNRI